MRDHCLGAPVGEIAVRAIDVAEWRRLNDQQFHNGHRTPRLTTLAAAAYQLRQKLFQAGLKLAQFPQGRPHHRRRFQPPLNHRLPQTSWTLGSPWLPVRPEPATRNTASRMAASRSDTPCSAPGGRRFTTRSAASLGSIEPSNSDTPTAPIGAMPDMMRRYFRRSFISPSIVEQYLRPQLEKLRRPSARDCPAIHSPPACPATERATASPYGSSAIRTSRWGCGSGHPPARSPSLESRC